MKRCFLFAVGVMMFISVTPWETELDFESSAIVYLQEKEEKRVEKEFERFLAHLAFKESSGRPYIDNGIGYMGKYQFGRASLKDIGIDLSVRVFRANPMIFSEEMQDLAIRKWLELNKSRLQEEIDRYAGSIVNGIHITEAGILAASHLGGVWGVKRYFRNGKNPSDVNGTSLEKYLKEFSKFDITKRDVVF